MTAGFSRPIIVYRGYYDGAFYLFLDKSYILYNDNSMPDSNTIYMRQAVSEYDKIEYERSRPKEREYKNTAIDNCGNIDFNVKKSFEKSKDNIGKGG